MRSAGRVSDLFRELFSHRPWFILSLYSRFNGESHRWKIAGVGVEAMVFFRGVEVSQELIRIFLFVTGELPSSLIYPDGRKTVSETN